MIMSKAGLLVQMPGCPGWDIALEGKRGERWGWAGMSGYHSPWGPPWAVLGGLDALCSPSCFLPPLPTAEAYVGGMLFCLGIFLSFYLLTVLLACWENWR